MVSMRWCNVNYVGYSTKLCGKPFSSLINREYHIASNSDVQKKVLIGPYVPLQLMEGSKQKKRGHYSKYLLDAKHPIPRTRLR